MGAIGKRICIGLECVGRGSAASPAQPENDGARLVDVVEHRLRCPVSDESKEILTKTASGRDSKPPLKKSDTTATW
jgi:hypothetical protein